MYCVKKQEALEKNSSKIVVCRGIRRFEIVKFSSLYSIISTIFHQALTCENDQVDFIRTGRDG